MWAFLRVQGGCQVLTAVDYVGYHAYLVEQDEGVVGIQFNYHTILRLPCLIYFRPSTFQTFTAASAPAEATLDDPAIHATPVTPSL